MMVRTRRRLLWLVPLLLATPWCRAEGEAERPPARPVEPRDPTPPKSPPKTVEEALATIKGNDLTAQLQALLRLREQVAAGDFRSVQRAAVAIGDKVRNLPAVEADLAARATIAASAFYLAAEMAGLQGFTADAEAYLRQCRKLAVTNDLKALADFLEAGYDADELRMSAAVSTERRAIMLDDHAVRPVYEALDQLYRGQSAGALAQLRRSIAAAPKNLGAALLYGAAAALSAGQLLEASTYWQQATASSGYLPLYHLLGGFLAAAGGDMQVAAERFDMAGQRESGRLRRGAFLASVARLAAGDGGAAGRLHSMLSRVPDQYRLLGEQLIDDPAPQRAVYALRNPALWWTLPVYGRPEAWVLPSAVPPGTPTVVSGPDTLATVAGGGGAQPDANPAGQPEAAPGAAAPTAPAGGAAAGAPTPIEPPRPADYQGCEVLATSTQGVEAYRTALRLLREGKQVEAEVTLESAVRIRPRFPEAWFALGQLRYLRGAYAAAVGAYRIAAMQRPQWPEAFYSLAQAADKLDRRADATILYSRALELGLSGDLAAYAKQRLDALKAAAPQDERGKTAPEGGDQDQDKGKDKQASADLEVGCGCGEPL